MIFTRILGCCLAAISFHSPSGMGGPSNSPRALVVSIDGMQAVHLALFGAGTNVTDTQAGSYGNCFCRPVGIP